eukprot:GFKZ01012516.1.p1 GENE.GFKZ01012516.1~~GFKZ01012516.1.p1  ORF type:complete len:103 (+),score=11.43 GFKZ01012516.1:321-629(+)
MPATPQQRRSVPPWELSSFVLVQIYRSSSYLIIVSSSADEACVHSVSIAEFLHFFILPHIHPRVSAFLCPIQPHTLCPFVRSNTAALVLLLLTPQEFDDDKT